MEINNVVESKLNQLLKSIDPVITMEKVEARASEAINSFKKEAGTIKHWEDFKTLLTIFFVHLDNTLLRLRQYRPPHPDIDWGRCCKMLIKQFGPHGEKAAFEMARTGTEGGLYAVLKAIADQLSDEYGKAEIKAKVCTFWNSLSTDEKLATADQYLKTYGYLLPSEMTERGAGRIKANFLTVLENHPQLVSKLKTIR